MRYTFCFPAVLARAADESTPDAMPEIGDILLEAEHMDIYMEVELADVGIVGGQIHLTGSFGSYTIEVHYWAPTSLDRPTIEALGNDTLAQMNDGMGEGGFDFCFEGEEYHVDVDTSAEMNLQEFDDGKVIEPPSQLAMAARDGDTQRVKELLNSGQESPDARHQGYPALHLAILYGHVESAKDLISAGANPNSVCPQGDSPLICATLASDLNDRESSEIVKILLMSGANRTFSSERTTAEEYAVLRNKPLTASVIREAVG